MEAFVNQLLESIDPTAGPFFVFGLLLLSGLGVPLGEDIINIPAGILVGLGRMPFWPTVLAAYLGVVCGDMLWFQVCSRWGTRIMHSRIFRRIVHPRRMLQVKHQFDHRGGWVIIAARFIPASRTSAIAVAGLMHMSFWKFAMITMTCCLITAPLQVGAGWLIAQGLGSRAGVDRMLWIVGFVAFAAVAVLVGRTWLRHKGSGSSPRRARASWLRHFWRRGRQ